MWWIPTIAIAGYLLAVRGMYGFLSWKQLLEEDSNWQHTAERNTHINRLFTAWLWPFMIMFLIIAALGHGLHAFVTGGWR
ncbi:MAG TPA: hypothetical protein VGG75_13590 [Trebonia sp.]|jgi:hypothetical protein